MRSRNKYIFIYIIVLVMVMTFTIPALASFGPGPSYDLKIVITDSASGDPISGLIVEFYGSTKTTDANGSATFAVAEDYNEEAMVVKEGTVRLATIRISTFEQAEEFSEFNDLGEGYFSALIIYNEETELVSIYGTLQRERLNLYQCMPRADMA